MNVSIHPGNYQNYLGLPSIPLLNGKKKVKLKPQKQKVDIEDISIPKSMKQQMIRQAKNISMQESLPRNKSAIYKDKLLFYKKNIPTMKLSKTLDQESILKEKDSLPFWTTSLEEMYHTLWSPIETDLQDLDMTCSHISLQGLKCPLQSSKIMTSKNLQENWQRTSCRSLRFSQPDTMDLENIQYTRKMRIFPNTEQKELFNKCLGASRYFYNQGVAMVEKKLKQGDHTVFNRQILRRLVMKRDSELNENDKMNWQKDRPYDTRDEAIADVLVAYKSAFTNLRNGNIKSFNISFKSKKNKTTESFKVNIDAFNFENMTIFSSRLNKNVRKLKFKKQELKNFKKPEQFFIVLKTRPNYWYICFPQIKEKPIYDNPVYKSVFLDPGVRTFQSFYSPDGICGKIANGQFQDQLEKLAKKHDQLHSCISNCHVSKTKRHLKDRCAKLRLKIKNKVDNLHWQTCSFLCKTFQNIFLPLFEVSKMVEGSPLGSKITRKMLQLSHGKFRERLKWYGQTKNRNVYIIDEYYTTKTCGNCGIINPNVGSSKTFKCDHCHYKVDRDLGAARNICLRLMTKFI